MQVITEPGRKPIKAWVDGVELEDAARQQLLNVASMPFVHRHVAVMPDVHWGMGATVGSVIPTRGAIIPAAVGVDIGCGMIAQRLNLTASDLPDNLAAMRDMIEQAVPHGRTDNGGRNDKGAWHRGRHREADDAWVRLEPGLRGILTKHAKIGDHNALAHLGSLGTGNHFIEVCLDEAGGVWAMLHSGSRGVGNRIGTHFIALAKREMERWFIHLPDADLAYIPEGAEHFKDYIDAVRWAQDFAATSRRLMLGWAVGAIGLALHRDVVGAETAVACHHNYISRETHFGETVWLTRKGAVSAKLDELGIIPGSMGVRSYIVRGKGNPESFMSCSHGAGRRMSRGQAKRQFTIEDHVKATEGVECRKDADVIDETPGAYKDIDAVLAAEADLVEVVHTLKQVVCVKG